jgi:hemolysin III
LTNRSWNYTRTETSVDGIVHLAGTVLATAGAILITAAASAAGDVTKTLAVAVYALSLVASLVISAAYSMWPVGPRKWRLRTYDHAAIYLLIAGTYTPFAVSMGGSGSWLLAGIWMGASAGALIKLRFPGRYSGVSVALYLGLAWSGVLISDALLESFPAHIFGLLLAGGLIYSAGVPFHLWQKLRFHKAIWHAFVLAAATVHYVAVLLLVLAQGS